MPGVTQFDRPIGGEFMDTYAPIPFQEMMQAGMLKQAQGEQSSQLMSGFYTGLGSIKIRPENQAYFQNEWLPSIRAKTDALMQEDPTMSTPAFRMGLNKVIRETRTDPWIMTAMQEYPAWEAHREDVREHKGSRYNIYEAMRSQPPTHELIEEGEIYRPGRITEEAHPRTFLETYVDDLMSSGTVGDFIDKETGRYRVTIENKGKSSQALGKSLGINFKVVEIGEVDEQGRQKMELQIDRENSGLAPGFFGGLAHENLTNIVKEKVRSRTDIETEEDFEKLSEDTYFGMVASVINERVTSNVSVTSKADPYALARAKEEPVGPIDAFRSTPFERPQPRGDLTGLEVSSTGEAFVGMLSVARLGKMEEPIKKIQARLEAGEIDPKNFVESAKARIDDITPKGPKRGLSKLYIEKFGTLTQLTFDVINAREAPAVGEESEAYTDLRERVAFELGDEFTQYKEVTKRDPVTGKETTAKVLSHDQRNKEHDKVREWYTEWKKDETLSIGIRPEPDRIKRRNKQELLFGPADDKGQTKVQGNISGQAAFRKIHNPTSPGDERTLNEHIADVSKKDRDAQGNVTLLWLGAGEADNHLAAGIQLIAVAGKQLAMEGTIREAQEQFEAFGLYSLEHQPSGKGVLFVPKEGYEVQSMMDFESSVKNPDGTVDYKYKIKVKLPNGNIDWYYQEDEDYDVLDIYNKFVDKYGFRRL